jgi:hypothetical protein
MKNSATLRLLEQLLCTISDQKINNHGLLT